MGLKLAVVIGFGVCLSSCYFNSTLSTLDSTLPIPSAQVNKLVSLENVSGSTGYVLTPVSGFKVKQSAGLQMNKQVAVTPNGYRVYLHASGRMTSEEINQ